MSDQLDGAVRLARVRNPITTQSRPNRLNPEAMEFAPTTRPSTKRKATSSAKSTLLPPNSKYSHANRNLTRGDPVSINSSELFGSHVAADPTDAFQVRYDLDESDLSDLEELVDEIRANNNLPLQSTTTSTTWQTLAPGAQATQDGTIDEGLAPSIWTRNIRNVKAQESRDPLAVFLIKDDSAPTSDHNPASRSLSSSQIRYLPLCRNPRDTYGGRGKSSFTVLPSHSRRMRHQNNDQQPQSVAWPGDEIPVELFDLITCHLDRDDIKSMRLVSKEFERKVCKSLFRTVVVPFNTEIYDMIDEDKKSVGRALKAPHKGKGKGKATEEQIKALESTGLQWQNAKDDKDGKVYKGHGLRVFQGFGSYIKRFGMSFEVMESQLSSPPTKRELDLIQSYHGAYDWPSVTYARFAKLDGLEKAADETSRMKAAFSHLPNVSELALSVSSGLGWLDGPDISTRAKILQRPSAVFDDSDVSRDRKAEEFWAALRDCHDRSRPYTSLKEISHDSRTRTAPLNELIGLSGKPESETQLWSTLDQGGMVTPLSTNSSNGLSVLSVHNEPISLLPVDRVTLNPTELKKEQKEWLLETEWAQRAFLESYVLAVTDNPAVFSSIRSLKIAKLSSGLMHMVSRSSFWAALPSLKSVTVHISPDWRAVERDDAGYAETSARNSSQALPGFYNMLREQVAGRDNITELNIGWADGGEHAQGMFARNANVLPAPISPLEDSIANSTASGLVFKHVQHLTLHNCWITPPMLEGLVRVHADRALTKLTLNSVSLTSHPRFPANAHLQHQAQAVQAMVNHIGQQTPQQMAVIQQHYNQQIQLMQQMFNNPAQLNNIPLPQLPIPGLGGAPPAPLNFFANPPAPSTTTTSWTIGHREGSWPELLDKISPGPIFSDYLPPPQPWEELYPQHPPTNLKTLELISCGYVRLSSTIPFDQSGLDPDVNRLSPWFRARWIALKPFMLDASRDRMLGVIVQSMPVRETNALRYAWDLRTGWRDVEKAEEAEFDGKKAGGTGRVSGVISKGDKLVGEREVEGVDVGGGPEGASSATQIFDENSVMLPPPGLNE